MDSNLTGAYALHNELMASRRELRTEQLALLINNLGQWFFAVGTWIIYLLFAAAMYAAPLWVLEHFFAANADNELAVWVIGALVVVFPSALAVGKHIGYRALARRGVDMRWVGLIVAFFISSGIYFEVTSATSQQQEKAHQAVENSNAGKSIMGMTVSVGSAASAAVGEAEFKLVACQRKLSEGNVKDCKNSQAALDGLKQQAAADRAAAVAANTAAIPAKQAALEAERDSHALPVAKTFAAWFGVGIAAGAVLAAMVGSFIFEISHALTIFNEGRLMAKIEHMTQAINQGKVKYFAMTGKQFHPRDFRDTDVIDMDKLRRADGGANGIPAAAFSPAPGILQRAGQAIAGEMALAQGMRDSIRQRMTGGSRFTDEPQVRESGGFRQSPEQLAKAKELAGDMTYREELRNGSEQFHDGVLDAPRVQPEPNTNAVRNAFAGKSAAEIMADPSAYQLLKKYVQHPRFDEAFIGVATACIPCSQRKMMQAVNIGGDMAFWVMIILEAWEIVTEPKANSQRDLVRQMSSSEAQDSLNEVKSTILG